MILAFLTEELRDICESELRAQREFGITTATELLALLADLLAADNLGTLPAELIRDANDGTSGAYEVAFSSGCIVRLGVRQYAGYRNNDGAVDRSRIRRVMIYGVEKPEVGNA